VSDKGKKQRQKSKMPYLLLNSYGRPYVCVHETSSARLNSSQSDGSEEEIERDEILYGEDWGGGTISHCYVEGCKSIEQKKPGEPRTLGTFTLPA